MIQIDSPVSLVPRFSRLKVFTKVLEYRDSKITFELPHDSVLSFGFCYCLTITLIHMEKYHLLRASCRLKNCLEYISQVAIGIDEIFFQNINIIL